MCEPALKADVVKFAVPPERLLVANNVVPSMNVTVPVGVVVADATVAVNFTEFPCVDGFFDEVTVVVVLACVTVCANAREVLFAFAESPLYVAMMLREPAGRFDFVSVAVPVESSVTVPSDVAPFLKVRVPVGVFGPFVVTVVVSVTAWP